MDGESDCQGLCHEKVVLMEKERREWETPLHILHCDPERFL